MVTVHDELMRRMDGLVDLPPDVIAVLLTELDIIALQQGMNLKDVQEEGYQDFACREIDAP